MLTPEASLENVTGTALVSHAASADALESIVARSKRISLRVEVPPRAYLGRALQARLVLDNRDRLSVSVEYALDLPRGMLAGSVQDCCGVLCTLWAAG